MSRLIDLVLLVGVGVLGWWLVRAEPDADGAAVAPITTTIQVRGAESLKGLGILLVPGDEHASAAMATDTFDDVAPHQLSPWQASRRTQILVPTPGSYRVRWGLQEEAPPRRARDVMQKLAQIEKLEDQPILIPEGATTHDVFEIDLPEVHARGLRRLAADG